MQKSCFISKLVIPGRPAVSSQVEPGIWNSMTQPLVMQSFSEAHLRLYAQTLGR